MINIITIGLVAIVPLTLFTIHTVISGTLHHSSCTLIGSFANFRRSVIPGCRLGFLCTDNCGHFLDGVSLMFWVRVLMHLLVELRCSEECLLGTHNTGHGCQQHRDELHCGSKMLPNFSNQN